MTEKNPAILILLIILIVVVIVADLKSEKFAKPQQTFMDDVMVLGVEDAEMHSVGNGETVSGFIIEEVPNGK